MTGLIFTHPPDYLAASYAARSLIALGVQPVIAIHRDDPHLHVDGARIVRTRAPRHGNLNGKPFIREALELMQEQASGDWVIKLDSDSLVFRLDWLTGKQETGVGLYHPEHRAFYGFCYALRSSRLPDLISAMEILPDGVLHHEDVAVGSLAAECGGVYRYHNLTPENRLGAYKWSTAKPPSWWRTRYDALCYQRTDGKERRNVIEKMHEFLGQ